MSFTLSQVVPWGRSFEEYVAMFALTDADLGGRILGCGDGPASFNAVLAKRGGRVVSVDPLYRFSRDDIRERIRRTSTEVLEQTRKNAHEFIWTSIKSVEGLGCLRMAAMEEFLLDYPQGVVEKRYVEGELPHLPFRDRSFDLAVCSHLLFLYSEQLSEDFHVESIQELCRVASEARVFPLLELGSKKSRHVPAVMTRLAAAGYAVSIETVPHEFQRGGHQMMRVKAAGEAKDCWNRSTTMVEDSPPGFYELGAV
jgi:SAM-dependent methyltransferase